MNRRIEIITGIAALFAGALVYVTDRPAESSFFMNHYLKDFSLYTKIPAVFGQWGNNFPAFIHVFSFSLITSGIAGSKKSGCMAICFFWFFINSFFELGQLYSRLMINIVPIPAIRDFFLKGTFDYLDIIAFATGGIFAYALLITTRKEEFTL